MHNSDKQTSSTGTGCAVTGQTSGDFHLPATDGRGSVRDFEVIVPSDYKTTVPLALTFVFHGADGNEATAKSYGLQDATGAAGASIFIFPQGVKYENEGIGWNDRCSGYDMIFFDHMVQSIQTKYCVNSNRIFLAGFSWGCDFATALACCRGSQIRAVAAASCSDEFSNPTDYKTYANYPCPTTSSAAIRFTHDSRTNGDGQYSGAQFAATRKLYEHLNGCTSASVAITPAPCTSFQGCAHPFIECSYAGLGHAVPANWANETWSFFSTMQ
jgi:polyhydroxybutyrate depolymerase